MITTLSPVWGRGGASFGSDQGKLCGADEEQKTVPFISFVSKFSMWSGMLVVAQSFVVKTLRLSVGTAKMPQSFKSKTLRLYLGFHPCFGFLSCTFGCKRQAAAYKAGAPED